uniref:Uncharacterized protein n=1 Tax=Anopheles albimanus TaxID=7167 RepID=A0A182FI00_ANOAL
MKVHEALTIHQHEPQQQQQQQHPQDAPVSSSLSSAHGSIERLIDQYLGPLYPHYDTDHTRPMLIRQARDLLVCTYRGDLERFEGHFLRPATDIVRQLRTGYQQGKVSDREGC